MTPQETSLSVCYVVLVVIMELGWADGGVSYDCSRTSSSTNQCAMSASACNQECGEIPLCIAIASVLLLICDVPHPAHRCGEEIDWM